MMSIFLQMPVLQSLAWAADTRDPNNWVRDFKSFTLFHLVTVIVFVATMVVSCKIGRGFGEGAREARFRKTWGWLIIVYQSYYTLGYLFPKVFFFPKEFSWEESLPLQLCDLAAFVAGATMVWQTRWLRSLNYFWGIGLSTQAFLTPTLTVGLGNPKYWMFFVGHTMIVGSAVYDVVVLRYRPKLKDMGVAIAISLGYVGAAVATNLILDRSGLLAEGVRANYGYMGNTLSKNRTIIDELGSWPLRIFKLMGIVTLDFFLLWGVWQVVALFKGRGAAAHPEEGAKT
jgi:hypothetical integral membrane protein (TIGR02206 family)